MIGVIGELFGVFVAIGIFVYVGFRLFKFVFKSNKDKQ
jgi:hypothetical protein